MVAKDGRGAGPGAPCLRSSPGPPGSHHDQAGTAGLKGGGRAL